MQHATTKDRWLNRAPMIVALGAGVSLGIALAAVLAIDVLDAFGLRDAVFVQRDSDYPYVFYHLFADRHPVEWLQWLLLIVAGLALAVSAGRLQASGETVRPWGVALLAMAVAVLAVKDAGSPRHVAADMVSGWAGGTVETLVELAFLGGVGLLALCGLVAAWPDIRERRAVRNVLLAGYGVYALAGMMSATSDLWYVRAGRFLFERAFGDRLLPAPAAWDPGLRSWLFMDSVVEESVELVAAALLAVAALMLLRDLARERARAGRAAGGPPRVPVEERT